MTTGEGNPRHYEDIRPAGEQNVSYIRKNCGLFFGAGLPQAGFGGDVSVVTARVAEFLDQAWVCGKNQWPGACDPTYSFFWAINATRTQYNPQMDVANPLLAGCRKMIYSSVYDDELLMLDYTHVKEQ